MSLYDQQCAEEFSLIRSRVDSYFMNLRTACPYGLPYVATFHQAMFCPLDQRIMELFLAAGYRRNGNCLYTMRCVGCSACVPVRLDCTTFRANRNQRRVRTKNADIVISLDGLVADAENLLLCQKFLEERYPQKNNTAEGYFDGFFLNGIVDSLSLQYRLAGRLVGSAVVDIGENWLNAVYFYFDPDEGRRSLGTFNILTLVDLCQERGIDYLYLGYYIQEVAAMSYKGSFRPHYLYLDGFWQSRE
ncbi:MAG: arginyltransferase [Desulfoprunum sp.]|nr:arginyltransferase [Desulfoprunum sp.]